MSKVVKYRFSILFEEFTNDGGSLGKYERQFWAENKKKAIELCENAGHFKVKVIRVRQISGKQVEE
jgi:hypothetical protein